MIKYNLNFCSKENPLTFIFIFLCCFLSIQVFAQESDTDIIRRAMKDEMKRSMDSLKYKDFGKPFFIAYRFDQNKSLNVSSTLGALTSSNLSKSNNTSVRLMVGNYQMNDENFQTFSSFNNGYSGNYIPTPVEIDYYAIRRALWVSTDEVYKSAGEIYKTKLSVLKKHNITIDDYVIPDFAQIPIVKYEAPLTEYKLDKKKWENIARKVSEVFIDFSEINSSGVHISIFTGNSYFVNSEGTEVVQPIRISSISVYAGLEVESGKPISDYFDIYAQSPDDFPNEIEILNRTRSFANYLLKTKAALVYEDIYTGPVLFVDEASANLFSAGLFGNAGLIAQREQMLGSANLISIPDKPNVNSIEAKIGKKVISKDLTVLALPKLRSFNNESLLGSFEIDAEGVIPSDTLVLIKDGILESLLNGRTPSIMIRESNGHNRLGSVGLGISSAVSPGVIKVSGSNNKKLEELRQQLFELASEEDLEYAFIVKKNRTKGYQNINEVYKVNIDDGTEELVRGAVLERYNMKMLKKIVGVSDSLIVNNSSISMNYMGGAISSFIVPDAVLINEMEIKGTSTSTSNKLPIVKNPLIK